MDVLGRAMQGAIAESKNLPFILNIYAQWRPCHRAIPSIPGHTIGNCFCVSKIPSILGRKKGHAETGVAKQVISLMRESAPCELLAVVHMTTTRMIIILISTVKNNSHLNSSNLLALPELLLIK